MKKFVLPNVKFTKEQIDFRKEVRSFLNNEKNKRVFETQCDSWMSGYSAEFSKKLGNKGWIGMTWPKKYGGGNRSAIERYIVIEELLAAGAPIASHWFADRQTGPLLLEYGTEDQKQNYLPKISAGTCYFSIGLSEPNSGSDLASLSTRAKKVEGGWKLNGSKTWTSGAHHSDYMIVLCRTAPADSENRHAGMSQLIVNLKAEGVTIAPIQFLTGEHHFNEVFFEDVFIPNDAVVGEIGNGWQQGMAELSYERSGPERLLSTFPLLEELIHILRKNKDFEGMDEAMKLVSELYNLRLMSIGVAQLLEKEIDVSIEASLIKDMGTEFERKIYKVARLLVTGIPSVTSNNKFDKLLAQSILHGPGFTLRGGTTEILRGIVTKGLVRR